MFSQHRDLQAILYSLRSKFKLLLKFLYIFLESENPHFTYCPSNISVPTDPRVPTKNVRWRVPTALDRQGNPLNVTVEPAGYAPPVSFRIGSRVVEYTATDRDSLSSTCQFFVEVRGMFVSYVLIFGAYQWRILALRS